MSQNIVDAIYVALGLDTSEYKKGVKEADSVSKKFATDEEKRGKERQASQKKLTEAEREAAKARDQEARERERQEKQRDAQARAAISQLNTMKNAIMGMMGVSLGVAGVQKFLSVVIGGNAELYRQSKMLNTEMKTLDVWMRVADNYRKGSGQGVVGTLQGIQQARQQWLHGTGGKEQKAGLSRSGINPELAGDPEKLILAARKRLKGKSAQEQLFWLSQWGGEGLLPLMQQTDQEFEGNLSFARANSSKNQKLGKDAYENESLEARRDANLAASADELGNHIVPLLKELNKFLSEHKDAVAYATGAIWALGTTAGLVAGARALGGLARLFGLAAPAAATAAPAAAGGASLLPVLGKALKIGGPAAFLAHSSDLNHGEDEWLEKNRAKGKKMQELMASGMSYEAAYASVNQSSANTTYGSKAGRSGILEQMATGATAGAIGEAGFVGTRSQNMSAVVKAFMAQGLSLEQARVMGAEVGRENGFQNKYLFGRHTDAANGATNVGMFSWQGDRAQKLLEHLRSRGLLDASGNIKQTQEALNAQAEFSVGEMRSGNPKWSHAWSVLNDPNASRLDKSNTVGRDYVQWAIDNPRFSESGIQNREKFHEMLENSKYMISAGQGGSMVTNTNSNNQTAEVHIDNINIQADTKDVNRIASSLPHAIRETGILPGFVRGQN